MIGDISRLDTKFQNTIRELEEATKKEYRTESADCPELWQS